MRPALVTVTAALLAATGVFGGGAQPHAAAQGTTTIAVGDFFFCDQSLPAETCVTTINAGDTVVWDYAEGTAGHTVTHCGDSCDNPTDTPLWDSGAMGPGESFSFTFQSPGTYLYRCDFHPIAMRATIVVQSAEAPTAAATPTLTPAPTAAGGPTATPMPTAATTATPMPTPLLMPPTGGAADGDGGVPAWGLVLAGVGGGLALLAGGLIAWRKLGGRP